LVAALDGPHLVISTSVRNGGQLSGLRYLANHQSCEAAAHAARHELITGNGQEAYHDQVCLEMGLPAAEVAMMGTAANMNYAAVVTAEDAGVSVSAIVTAGVHGNSACAGDPAAWREGESGWDKVAGTINTMLLINRPLTEGALARAVVTMTEAKSAALNRLSIRSLYSHDMATGTGTDQFAIAAPNGPGFRMTATSPHVKLGELIGRSVRDATLEALRWQNGLEPSYTRGVFSALSRFGLNEETFFTEMESLLSAHDAELLKKNSKAVAYEPLVGAAAHAMAAVHDRMRYGVIPASAAHEALRHQAATIAASLSAKPFLWHEFHGQLNETDPVRLTLRAIALGWAAKWRT
jgi:adenosylcobinamide amidohydrolase